jgi:hypothetical protein
LGQYVENGTLTFLDMLPVVTGQIRTEDEAESYLAGFGIVPTVVPPLTTFDVLRECDGDGCDCGAVEVKFTDGPLKGETVILGSDQILTTQMPEDYGTDSVSDFLASLVDDVDYGPEPIDLSLDSDGTVVGWDYRPSDWEDDDTRW